MQFNGQIGRPQDEEKIVYHRTTTPYDQRVSTSLAIHTPVYSLNESLRSLKLPQILLQIGKRIHEHMDLQDLAMIPGITN